MSDPKPQTNLYTIGGAVQAGGGVYLPRAADDELLALCLDGNFSYVLTPRQMGKTSLMVRTAERLSEAGVQSVIIDLTQIGVQVTVEAWYLGLLTSIEDQLMLSTNAVEWWEERKHQGLTQRLAEFFKDVLLKEVEGRVVVFVDEIDTTLSLTFTDDFYAAIRYFFNARAHTPELKRLSFVLIGVATPSDLVRDPQRTPFNIGHRVDLTDFTADEALPLAEGLGLAAAQESRRVLGWVMEWTGGHPYLTQRLCRAVAEEKRENWTREDVERLTGSVFFGEMSEKDHNLQFVRDMLTRRAPDPAGVLATYREVLRNRRPVPDEEQSIIKSHLKLSGIVYRKQGSLHVRNPIYRRVFDDHWVGEHLPINWMKRLQRIAAVLALLILVGLIPLSIYAINRAWKAEEQTSVAQTQTKFAEKQRQEAEIERANAIAAKREAETQRMNAETAAEKEKLARADAEKQRALAEEQRSRAESAAQEASRQAALARASQQQAEAAREEADHLRKLAFGGQLGALAQITGNQQASLLQRSALIARESILQSPEAPPLVGYQALNQALMLLPLPVKEFHVGFPVTKEAFSPDRKLLVTVSEDTQPETDSKNSYYTINVFDSAKGYSGIPGLSRKTLVQETHFSPDLTHLATVKDGKVSVVELTTGRETSFDVQRSVKNFELGPGGKYAAYLDEDNQTIHLRDVPGKLEIDTWKAEGVSRIKGFSSTCKYLVMKVNIESTIDKERWTLVARDITARREVKRIETTINEWLLFSPDDEFLIERLANKDLVVKRTKDFEEVTATVKDPGNAVFAFRPDSSLLAVSDNGNILRVVAVEGGGLLAGIKQDDILKEVSFSPDGKYLEATSVNDMSRVWNVGRDFSEAMRIIHSHDITNVEFGPDGNLLTTDSEGNLQVWEPKNDLDFIHKTVSEEYGQAMLTPDGRYFAQSSSSSNFSFKMWDTTIPGKVPLDSIEFEEIPLGVALSPDGKYVAATFGDSIRVWEVATKHPPREIKIAYAGSEIAISAGGKYVATIEPDKPDKLGKIGSKAQVWEVATGKLIAANKHEDGAVIMAFSPDGEYFASSGKTLQLLRLTDRRKLPPVENTSVIAFSPHGKYLAMASTELMVWARDTGQVIALADLDVFGSFDAVAFSEDERYMASSNVDVAQVWDVDAELKATKHEGVASFKHDTNIYTLALTSNGDHLVTISEGGYARVWDVRNRREVARIPYWSAAGNQYLIAFTGQDDMYMVATHTNDGAAEVWRWKPDDLAQMSCSRLILEKTSAIPWKDYLDEQLLNALHIKGDCPDRK
jgi:WD40 repeat protein/Skp family chaperone for outer membrane proteins